MVLGQSPAADLRRLQLPREWAGWTVFGDASYRVTNTRVRTVRGADRIPDIPVSPPLPRLQLRRGTKRCRPNGDGLSVRSRPQQRAIHPLQERIDDGFSGAPR